MNLIKKLLVAIRAEPPLLIPSLTKTTSVCINEKGILTSYECTQWRDRSRAEVSTNQKSRDKNEYTARGWGQMCANWPINNLSIEISSERKLSVSYYSLVFSDRSEQPVTPNFGFSALSLSLSIAPNFPSPKIWTKFWSESYRRIHRLPLHDYVHVVQQHFIRLMQLTFKSTWNHAIA